MVRFQNHITPLNAENLNELVDGIAESGIRADNAIDKANLVLDMYNEFINIFGNPITAQDFDGSNITADGFDKKYLTATQFDVIGRTILI